MINMVSFKGIIPPYTNSKGFYVTPIAKNPTQKDIDIAIQATKSDDSHCGLNGSAYFYGEDLVVKKYKNPKDANSYNPYREIKALDSMFDNNILSDNIQRGEFAFTTPEKETYLVSTKVPGANSNPITNKFNEANLKSIVDTIYQLDIPHKYPSSHSERKKFPYIIPMHYDLSMGNYNISETDAGIFDFEYLQYEDLNKPFTQMNYQFMPDTLSDLSDISGIVSNLRNFEYRGLLPYLKQIDSDSAREVFIKYIYAKSKYHLRRSQMFKNESINSFQENPSLSKDLNDLSKKEYIHFNVLSHPSHNVLKAEAIKIQIASFIYLQSPFSRSLKDKINPSQIREYINYANEFFQQQILQSNFDEKLYFKDCLDLMKSWNNLYGWMAYQESEPKIEDYMPLGNNPDSYSEDDVAKLRLRFDEQIKMHKLFQNKVTDECIDTLDEHLKL